MAKKKTQPKPWTQEDFALLKENMTLPNKVLAKKLNRTPAAVDFQKGQLQKREKENEHIKKMINPSSSIKAKEKNKLSAKINYSSGIVEIKNADLLNGESLDLLINKAKEIGWQIILIDPKISDITYMMQ